MGNKTITMATSFTQVYTIINSSYSNGNNRLLTENLHFPGMGACNNPLSVNQHKRAAIINLSISRLYAAALPLGQ